MQTFHIQNMTCGGCVRGVTRAIQSVGQGLLAVHMLARLQRGDGQLAVRVVRRAYVDHVDVGPRYELGCVGRGELKMALPHRGHRGLATRRADPAQFGGKRRRPVEEREAGVRVGVHAGNAAEADHADAVFA